MTKKRKNPAKIQPFTPKQLEFVQEHIPTLSIQANLATKRPIMIVMQSNPSQPGVIRHKTSQA